MAKMKHLSEKLLLQILGHLSLRQVLQLRRVSSTWRTIIDRDICHPKTSLKLFGSLKAVLDYYMMVNKQYHLIDGVSSPVSLTALSHTSTLTVRSGLTACNRSGCACRWDLVPSFRLHLPGSSGTFPHFTLPGDDHLIVAQPHPDTFNCLMRLFPNLESLIIFHVPTFSELYYNLPFVFERLHSLQLYDATVYPAGRPETDQLRTALAAAPLRAGNARHIAAVRARLQTLDLFTLNYRVPYHATLVHLQELTLDGLFISGYYLWELLLKAEPKGVSSLRRLTLTRFNDEALLAKRILKAMEGQSGSVLSGITHLTVDPLTYDVLEFFVKYSPELVYLDVTVDEGLKSWDLLASLSRLPTLRELRLTSLSPTFLLPIPAHYIFLSATLPPLTTLHLYLANLSLDKLRLLTHRIFPTVTSLVLDCGQLSCTCNTRRHTLKRTLLTVGGPGRSDPAISINESESKRETSELQVKSACSTCLAKLPDALQPGTRLYFYDGCKVIDAFYELVQQYFASKIKPALPIRTRGKRTESPVTPTPTPSTSNESPPKSARSRSVLARLRRGLQRISTRRRRATAVETTTSSLYSFVASPSGSGTGTGTPPPSAGSSFVSYESPLTEDGPTGSGSPAPGDVHPGESFEMRSLIRDRDFDWHAWLGVDGEDEENEPEDEEEDAADEYDISFEVSPPQVGEQQGDGEADSSDESP